ncbi:MAG: hypothetical protein VXZ82_21165 [Planctomycetota bacterium]|nr:hypothetical protein [Planctomycetota bacterium]
MQAFNASTGEQIPDPALSSELMHHLYEWHFFGPIPRGLNIAGLMGVVWVFLSLNGVYIQRRKLLKRSTSWRYRQARTLQSWIHTIVCT